MEPNPDRRCKRRVDVSGHITVFYKAGTRRRKGSVRNLSSIGALVEIDACDVYPGKLLELAFVEQDGDICRMRHHTGVVTHVTDYGAGILLLAPPQQGSAAPEAWAQRSS